MKSKIETIFCQKDLLNLPITYRLAQTSEYNGSKIARVKSDFHQDLGIQSYSLQKSISNIHLND